mgnify:CR=1 FL=1
MASSNKKKTKTNATKSSDVPDQVALDQLSIEELRAYLTERESMEQGGASKASIAGSVSSSTTASSDANGRAARSVTGALSVRETLAGKKIFIIGGTGFLGRVMLYMFLKYVPDLERIYVLIRPTHGRTGEDRLQREDLESPVFTEAADVEPIRKLAAA